VSSTQSPSVRLSSPLRPLAAVALFAAALAAPPAAATPRIVAADDAALPRQALRVAAGESLVVEGLWLEPDAAPVALELERVEVWTAGAVVEIDGVRRPAPATAVFRGRARGWLDSIAVLTVGASGETSGVVLHEGAGWVIADDRRPGAAGGLASRRADLADLDRGFACGNDSPELRPLALPEPPATEAPPATRRPTGDPGAAGAVTAASHAGAPYTASLALETDYEYYAKFLGRPDPSAAALDYLALLVAYADVVYSREIDTAMRIGYARLWTGGAASDPWTVASDTVQALLQFQGRWNLDMRHVTRTAAHFVSGKNMGGGVAYVGTLCQGHTSPGSANDYGLSASISGGFSWNGNPASNPAAVMWDVVVLLHEIGHNFNSPHSHDYCGLGASQAIDNCVASQACGTAAGGLPSCSSPTPHFSGGAGTIMSYCHFQPGAYGNIAMTFGEGHTCGVLPWRQADRMSAHVANRAAAVPACFADAGTPPPPPPACPPDAFEAIGAAGHDDACYGSQVVPGTAKAHTLCDEDWSWFTPRPGATYRIRTTQLAGGADTTLALHADCGSQIGFNDDADGGPSSRLDWTAPVSGADVDLRVRSAGAYGDDDAYTLSVTCIANCGTGCATNLALPAQTVSGTQGFKAENTIAAGSGFTVGGSGDVTFHAGGRVALGNGFRVAAGGSFRATAGTTPSCP
jgi:hypothetical protein